MITCIQTEFFLLVVRNIMLSNTPLPLSSEPWGGDKNRIIITVIRVLVAACGLTLALHALLPLLCRGLCSPTAPWPLLCTFRLTPLLRRRRHAVSLRGALCWNLSCWAAGGTGAGGITCWFYGGSQQTHIIAIRIGIQKAIHCVMFIVLDQTMFEIEAFSWCCRRRLTLLWYRALCRQTLSALYSCSFWCFGASTAHRTGRAAAPVVEEQELPSVLLGCFFLKITHIYLGKKKINKYGKTQVSCSCPDYKKVTPIELPEFEWNEWSCTGDLCFSFCL